MNDMRKRMLSIIIPTYNERKTLSIVVRECQGADTLCFEKEIIIVDDGSTDGSDVFLHTMTDASIRVLRNEKNQGKGAALKRALEIAVGDYIIIQDADAEYSPKNYPALLWPLCQSDGEGYAVFGSRVLKQNRRNVYYCGSQFLTALFNGFFQTHISDFSTRYKVFPRSLIPQLLQVAHNDFVFDVLYLTLIIARSDLVILDIPIEYEPRSYCQGKKLQVKHGVLIFYHLLGERFRTFRGRRM